MSKRLLAFMLPAYALSTAASLGVLMKSFSQRESEHAIHAGPIPGGKFCIIDGGLPTYTYAYWIANLSFDCFLCSLALVRGYRYYKTRGSGARLIDILIRDSLFYFLVFALSSSICEILIILQARFDAPIGFSVAISASLCNRLVLKVHAMQPGRGDTDRYGV
ncbi:hypothetical protein CVT25_011673 [Psilocybe cyanescens]|uniref:GtrA-like protein domain-containing protein n=1 Tax=Psilocybe cyanescens TaxID=93625 RepID=A0A409XWJ4_PSICY|nr:hypothetical protein CVT25_011673 [Psilocybe cyanescens]